MYDLRSDTVTRPSPAMREAMATAEVGDDVLGEDPTVARLERRVAELLGKEAALFVASGTMGNQICLGALAAPGDEIIVEARSHVLLHEVGATARLWGCQLRPVAGRGGLLEPSDVEAAVRERGDVHYPRTSVLSLENTHNDAGGVVLPVERLDELTALARRRGLGVHVDGARLFNAHVASGVPLGRMLAGVDMVSVCLSKGLGAPVGSVVACDAARRETALRLRKTLGGGWRQAGVLAAAALVALDETLPLLARDHARARALAEELAVLPGVAVDLATVQTNIVVAAVERDAPAVCARLAGHGVLAAPLDARRVRFVLHRDLGDDAVPAAIDAMHRACAV